MTQGWTIWRVDGGNPVVYDGPEIPVGTRIRVVQEGEIEQLQQENEKLASELRSLVDWFNDAPFLRAERALYDREKSHSR